MFEIEPKLDVNIDEFNKEYTDLKYMLDDLISYVDKSESQLDKKIEKYSYEEAYRLMNFLGSCKVSYVVNMLFMALQTYCHRLENEAFLDLYVEMQTESGKTCLESRSLSDLYKIQRCLQNDKNLSEMFSSVLELVVNKEKKYHI